MDNYSLRGICDKCGAGEAESKYIPPENIFKGGYKPEHMKRTCQNCGFIWQELPKDKD